MGSLKNCGRAAGEGGAGEELPGFEIRRRAAGNMLGRGQGYVRSRGQFKIPSERGVKGKSEVALRPELVIARFNITAGAAIILALLGLITTTVRHLATGVWHQLHRAQKTV